MSEATNRARELWQAGQTWEAIVADLRSDGFSKIDCIRVTVELLRVPLGEAKRLVHFSSAWADVRNRDETFQTLAAAALAVADESPDPDEAAVSQPVNENDLAQRLLAVVTTLREGDVQGARALVGEILADEEVQRVVLLSGVLTAALADIASVGDENLLAALGILVATTANASTVDTADAIARAEVALAPR
ncbi:MAG: hypothetical protein ACRD2W_07970 [Acidimicrobiales bacterium]